MSGAGRLPTAGTDADVLSLVRLLQLASPALPIGAYSYSQGVEWLIESRAIRDAATAERWLGDMLDLVVAEGEGPILWRLLVACEADDVAAFRRWAAWHRASRESRELRAETEQMGASLVKLVADLDLLDATGRALAAGAAPVTLPAAYALACRALHVRGERALAAYVMSWLENQVLVAVKGLPLGQVAGQRMLLTLAQRIPGVVARAVEVVDDDLVSFAPGLALASARHEAQYSRLFRS